jgi:predicted Zn-dependent protease
MITEEEARRLCRKVLGYVKAEDAIVYLSSDVLSNLRFASNTITTTGRSQNSTVQVSVWAGRKRGTASTNAFDDGSLRATVEQAEQFARVSPVDPEYLPSLSQQQYRPSHGYVAATADIPAQERARSIAEVIQACDKAKVLGYGFHEASGRATARASKHGNFLYERSSNVGLTLTVRTPDGLGSGFFQRDHFDVAKLDLKRIGTEAIRKAQESHGAKPISPGTYSVILEPQAVSDLLSFFYDAFDARQADEGRSPFAAAGGKTRQGEKLFDERINLFGDPWHPEVPQSAATREQVPAQRVFLIRNGVVETLTYSRFWASKKQTQPTPGPANSILEGNGPNSNIEEMVQSTKRGLLVSRFWYIRRTDPRTAAYTGLTRDGLWYLEDGKVQYPVRNFRFNQSLLEMLAPGNVERIGVTERLGSYVAMPAMQLKEFHFTSESDAV